jgi:hypothetical protein
MALNVIRPFLDVELFVILLLRLSQSPVIPNLRSIPLLNTPR